MSENNTNRQENDQLRTRRERMSGGPKRRGSPWLLFLFIIAIILLGAFIVFPEQTRRLLGLGTSSSEDIQRTSRTDNSGISTQLERDPTLVIESLKPSAPVIASPAQTAKLDHEADARIAALEKALTEIANRPANAP